MAITSHTQEKTTSILEMVSAITGHYQSKRAASFNTLFIADQDSMKRRDLARNRKGLAKRKFHEACKTHSIFRASRALCLWGLGIVTANSTEMEHRNARQRMAIAALSKAAIPSDWRNSARFDVRQGFILIRYGSNYSSRCVLLSDGTLRARYVPKQ